MSFVTIICDAYPSMSKRFIVKICISQVIVFSIKPLEKLLKVLILAYYTILVRGHTVASSYFWLVFLLHFKFRFVAIRFDLSFIVFSLLPSVC